MELQEIEIERQAKKLKPGEVPHYNAWLRVAEYFNHALNLTQAFEYVSDTLHIPVEELEELLKKVRVDTDFFPRPTAVLKLYREASEYDQIKEEGELGRRAIRLSASSDLYPSEILQFLRKAKKSLKDRVDREKHDFTKNNLLCIGE